MANKKEREENSQENINEKDSKSSSNWFLDHFPIDFLDKALRFKQSMQDTIGNPIGDPEQMDQFAKTMSTVINPDTLMNYTITLVNEYSFPVINHLGNSFHLVNQWDKKCTDDDKGIYVTYSGLSYEEKSGYYRKNDQTRFKLPTKNNPSIIAPLNLIVFYDNEDMYKFIFSHKDQNPRQVVLDYIHSSLYGPMPGIETSIINVSQNDYYTIINEDVVVIPKINPFSFHPSGQDKDLEEKLEFIRTELLKKEKGESTYDIILICKRVKNYNYDDQLGITNYNNYKKSFVTYQIAKISKERRESMKPIFIGDTNFIIYSNEQIAKQIIEKKIYNDPSKLLFHRIYEFIEEDKKEKNKKNQKERTEFNRSLLNMAAIVGGFAVGAIAATLSKDKVKFIFNKIKKLFNKKGINTARKAAKVVFSQGFINPKIFIMGGVGITTVLTLGIIIYQISKKAYRY